MICLIRICSFNQSGMMWTDEAGKDVGHDTMMCGDTKAWFPMRVTYSREMKVKDELGRLGIECFVPMTYRLVDVESEINNLVFVRSSQERISSLKAANEVLEPLRYMMDHTAGRKPEIMTVPDRQMENFLRVASKSDDSVMLLNENTIIGKVGKRVRIMGGQFEGVEGVIRRVKRCKRVVVALDGLLSVAIAYVPAVLLAEVE